MADLEKNILVVITTLEFLASHFPTTTFCWFPPERLPALTSTVGVLIRRSFTAFSQRSSSFLLLITPSLLQMRSRFGSARL